MITKHFKLGCVIVIVVSLIVLFLTIYFGRAAFLRYGISSDLADYRNSVLQMEIDDEVKSQILRDINDIRSSLDVNNNFSFFQWIAIDDSIQGIIFDGKMNSHEYVELQAEFERMKILQGL